MEAGGEGWRREEEWIRNEERMSVAGDKRGEAVYSFVLL